MRSCSCTFTSRLSPQVYFPELGRQLHLPAILQEKNLPAALQKRDCHVDILDLVCVQCEPDSEDYIRVSTAHLLYLSNSRNGRLCSS